jgi:hypothetical protein
MSLLKIETRFLGVADFFGPYPSFSILMEDAVPETRSAKGICSS